MDKDIEFRQIILVTDGESNVGCDPAIVAKEAYEKGITVNTIGIINGNSNEKPMAEIQKIAMEGGGIYEYTDLNNFSKTMQMVTQRSVYKTIEETVHKELKKIIGTGLKDLHPDSRKKIVNIIDKLGDEINIRCCIVVDLSGSMANKINIAKNSILNLLRVLNGRKGKTEIGVIGYPGDNDRLYSIISDFTEDINELEVKIQNINVGGTTPTGPALKAAVELLSEELKETGILESNIV